MAKDTKDQAVAIREGRDTIGQFLAGRQEQLAQVAASNIDVQRLIPMVMAQISQNPQLAQCSVDSVYRALHECVSRGLEPTGAAGGAHLVPYWNSKKGTYEAQLMLDYRGLLELARRSGTIAKVVARVVREYDLFEVVQGTDEVLKHQPVTQGDAGPPTAVFAVVTYKDGTTQFDWDTWAWVATIRKRSRSGDAGPWVTDEQEMAKKSILRRLLKLVPSATEAMRAIEFEEHQEAQVAQAVVVKPVPEAPVARIQERLGAPPADTPAPPPAEEDDGVVTIKQKPKRKAASKPKAPADTAKDAPAPSRRSETATADGACGAAPPAVLGMTEPCEMVGPHKVHRSDEGTWPVETEDSDADG